MQESFSGHSLYSCAVIDHIHTVLAVERKKDLPKHRAYMMLIGNYGRHMAFATDPPYCVVYATDYKDMQRSFQNDVSVNP